MGLDENVVSAIENYFKWGLYPGSFTESLLIGRNDDVLTALAHPHIRHLVDDHKWFIENCVPACCRGEYFKTWHGYDHAVKNDPELRTLIRLSIIPNSIAHKWIAEMEEDMKDYRTLTWEEYDVLP